MSPRTVLLLLPGQGLQHAGIAGHLWRDPGFAEAADNILDQLGTVGNGIRREWSETLSEDDRARGCHAQPLLFVVGYAIGRALARYGVRPTVMIGHSVGELAAAALAGVFDLAAAARVLRGRCTALAYAPRGGMLGVAAAPCRVRDHLGGVADPAVVGAHNAPAQTVISGLDADLARSGRILHEAGFVTRPVRASEPWHSPAMDRAAAHFRTSFAAETLYAPDRAIVSTRTAAPVSATQARQPEFWADQMARPVLFWPALSAVLDAGDVTVVDAGPGNGLCTIARLHPAVRSGRSSVVPLLPVPGRDDGWERWQAALSEIA